MPLENHTYNWNQLKSFVEHILKLPLSDQQKHEHLKQFCQGNQALLSVLQTVITQNTQQNPPSQPQPAYKPSTNHPSTYPTNITGIMVGAYTLCEEIGRGGMGVVYRAERKHGGFEQEVAIKILNNKYALLQRFQQEQQLLASLKHTNIAQFYDGGSTVDGEPYFVMEYVQGQTIDDYCDRHRLSIDQRLKLLTQVIDALDYAHQHLIVHRDVKPSNILVTAAGQIKLLDFGVAKLLSGDAFNDLTYTGEQLMTPNFATPEQLQGHNVSVGTDIYQLGLVAYELLTGKQAYRDLADSFITLSQLICNESPTKPSKIINQAITDFERERIDNTLFTKPTPSSSEIPVNHKTSAPEELDDSDLINKKLSFLRGLSPQQLQHKLKGDIDSIIMRMLRNEPESRFLSMSAVHSDIKAYFSQHPLSSRKNTVLYQTKKFAKRHWVYITGISLFIISLAAYAVSLSSQMEKTSKALAQSQVESRKSQQVSSFLINVFKSAGPEVAGLDTITAQELLENGEQEVLADTELSDETKTNMLYTIGDVYFTKGDYEKSKNTLTSALHILDITLNTDAPFINYHDTQSKEHSTLLFHIFELLAIIEYEQGQLDSAASMIKYNLEYQAQQYKALPTESALDYAHTLSTYSVILSDQGQLDTAEQHIEQAIHVLQSNENTEFVSLIQMISNLARIQFDRGNFELAEESYSIALDMSKQHLKETHPTSMLTKSLFADMLLTVEKFDVAEALLTNLVQQQTAVLGENHLDVAASFLALGRLNYELGEISRAEYFLKKSFTAQKQHASSASSHMMSRTRLLIAKIEGDRTNYEQAEHTLSELLNDPNTSKNPILTGQARQQYAYLQHQQTRREAAISYYEQAINSLAASDLHLASALLGLAHVLWEQKRYAEAETHAQRALSIRQQYLPTTHSRIYEAQLILALIFKDSHQTEKALSLLEQCLTPLLKHKLYRKTQRKHLLEQGQIALAALKVLL